MTPLMPHEVTPAPDPAQPSFVPELNKAVVGHRGAMAPMRTLLMPNDLRGCSRSAAIQEMSGYECCVSVEGGTGREWGTRRTEDGATHSSVDSSFSVEVTTSVNVVFVCSGT